MPIWCDAYKKLVKDQYSHARQYKCSFLILGFRKPHSDGISSSGAPSGGGHLTGGVLRSGRSADEASSALLAERDEIVV